MTTTMTTRNHIPAMVFVPCWIDMADHAAHYIGPGWDGVELYCGGIGPESVQAAGERILAIETLDDFTRRADDIAGRCQCLTLDPYAEAHEDDNVNRCSEYAVAGSPYCAECAEVFAGLDGTPDAGAEAEAWTPTEDLDAR